VHMEPIGEDRVDNLCILVFSNMLAQISFNNRNNRVHRGMLRAGARGGDDDAAPRLGLDEKLVTR